MAQPVSAQIGQVVLDRGGRIESVFLGAVPALVKVDLYRNVAAASGTGPAISVTGATASMESIDTTMTAPAQPGDRQIVVATATNIVAGSRVLIGAPSSAEPFEDVRIVSRDGATLKLAGPLMFRHSLATQVRATRAYYDVTSAYCTGTWGDGQARWTAYNTAGTAVDTSIEPQVEVVDCVRQKIPVLLAGMTDLLEVEPVIRDKLGANCDWMTGLANARDELLLLLGPNRHRFTIGVAELRRACALQFVINHAAALGPNHADETKRRIAERDDIVARIRQRPVDTDDDGLVGIADPGDSLNMAATDGPNTDATLNEPAFLGVDDWLSSV